MNGTFYGPQTAPIHHDDFDMLARAAAEELVVDLTRRGRPEGTVVDLGCGSGILARTLTDAGFDVLGIDMSPSMLELAAAHAPKASFRLGSVHDAVLPARCVAVGAIGEVLNYATDPRAGLDALERVAARVHDALVPDGLFLLDLAGPGRAGPGGATERFHRADSWCLGMRATESEGGRRLDREITIFQAGPDGRYERVEEHHVLRLYDQREVDALLHRVGFAVEIAPHYATGDPLPGWFVVRARRER